MPDYLVTDPATGQRIKMTGPAPPSEALIRLALAKVQPLPSHVPTQLQTPDPLQAMQKAQTIGPARVGERYQEDLNPSLVGIARKVLGGAQRPPSVAAEDPYGIGAWLKGAGPMPTPIAAEIQAYHGSPHDFEKFLLEKIGTGEGAQAYGHGLYFAENPAVAQDYRDKLARFSMKLEGKTIDPADLKFQMRGDNWRKLTNEQHVDLAAKDILTSEASQMSHFTPTPDEIIERAKGRARGLRNSVKDPDGQAHWSAVEQRLEAMKPQLETHQGKMYEVSIKADPDQFLDWDKPLKDQPEQLKVIRGVVPEFLRKDFDYNVEHGISGGNAYHNWVPGTVQHEGKAATSETLKAAGIPGIKYLDQGSRMVSGVNKFGDNWFIKGSSTPYATQAAAEDAAKAAGNATHNYVVFDDKLIDILKKYAVAGAVGGSLASLGQQPTEEQK